MGWDEFEKDKEVEEEAVYREKIEYKLINEEDNFGLNIAILGEDMVGKSLMAALFGYFNSKFLPYIDNEKYPNAIRLLKEGYMPEVEKIKVLDLDNSFRKSASRGTFKQLLLPFIRENAISYETIRLPTRQQRIVNGKVENFKSDELFKAKKKIEDAIEIACEDYGPETLFLIDSMSSYYEVLDDMFSIVWEYINDAEMFAHVDNQKDWRIRNSWWRRTMKLKRNYPGWQIDTIKVVEKPDHWKRSGQSPYNFKWPVGSGDNNFNLDMIYWLKRTEEGNAYADITNGRYKDEKNKQNNIEINYPLYTPEAAFVLIEKMAPYIMAEAEDIQEVDVWL